MNMLRRHWPVLVTIAFFVCSTTWLAGPHSNPTLVPGPNLISDYESAGMPFADVFRIFDGLAALMLLMLTWYRRATINSRVGRHATIVLTVIAILQMIDAIVPLSCTVVQQVCIPNLGLGHVIHNAESFGVMALIFGLLTWYSWKQKVLVWLPVAFVGLGLLAVFAKQFAPHWLFIVQTTSMFLGLFGLWHILLGDYFGFHGYQTAPLKNRLVRWLSVVVIASALFNLVSSLIRFVNHQPGNGHFLISHDHPWLAGHGFLATLATLYVVRNFWQGSLSAWRIITLLCIVEVVRYASLGAAYGFIFLYILLFCALLMSHRSFSLKHSLVRFRNRLWFAVQIIGITAVFVFIMSLVFRASTHRQIDLDNTNTVSVVSRLFLLEPVTAQTHSFRLRVFDSSLIMIGGFMYLWVFAGLFMPKQFLSQTNENEHETMRQLLEAYSTSSEDYFKLWPEDKQYYVSPSGRSAIAYAQSGAYFIALANPICHSKQIRRSLISFRDFSYSHGAKPVWFLIGQPKIEPFELAGYKLLPIGASAVVDIHTFCQSTVRNKWWRWKRNKALKSGMTYETILPPQLPETLSAVKAVSDSWLLNSHHEERGFALGYFNEKELTEQTLHVLRSSSGEIIAFANQLPQYRANHTTTIDMMRFRPEAVDAMAFLLSEIIGSLAHYQTAKKFDLGFVPLAHIKTSGFNQTSIRILRRLSAGVFSSHGLEQFKNKFEPTWHTNYLAYTGDGFDIPAILRAIVKVTKISA